MVTEKKETTKKPKKEIVKEVESGEKNQYWEGIGRRKTSTARVRIWAKGKDFFINDKKLEDYFPVSELRETAIAPLVETKLLTKLGVTVHTNGGGANSQAVAVRHGVAQALVKYNLDFHKTMRDLGFLTRDPRMKERKKPGLKSARKAPHCAKR